MPSAQPFSASIQAAITPGHLGSGSPRGPLVSPPTSPQVMPYLGEQGAAGGVARGTVGGLPEVWESFSTSIISSFPLCCPGSASSCRPSEGQWWTAMAGERFMLQGLYLCGLDREALVGQMQPTLEEDTEPVAHGLISLIKYQFSKGAWELLHFYTASQENVHPTARHWPSTSQAEIPAPQLACSSRSVGCRMQEAPAEQEQPQGSSVQVLAAGPSARTAATPPPPPVRAESAQLHGPDTPQRGDPLAPRTVPSPARGPTSH